MTREQIVNDLIEKLKEYKNVDKLEQYLNYTENLFNSLNERYECEIFPKTYVNEQKKILESIKDNSLGSECDYCEKALLAKKHLLSDDDSVYDIASDLEYFVKSCRKTCPKFTKEEYPYYLNDEGLECIDSMIEVFGVENVMTFCLINAYKFFWRCDRKDKIWDVEKGLSYLSLYRKLNDEYKGK